MLLLILYFILFSCFSFSLFGIDKYKAIHHAFRIPERTLFICSFLGGSYGALLGMKCFHHKTKKTSFRVIIPCLCILHTILILFVYFNY